MGNKALESGYFVLGAICEANRMAGEDCGVVIRVVGYFEWDIA